MNWTVTVTRNDGFAKAVFTWDNELQNCTVQSHGFTDEEWDTLLEKGAHAGADVDGYQVHNH